MEKCSCFVKWGLMAGVTLLPCTLAQADLGFWSGALVGTWRHPRSGDVYRFNSNATYTFTAGRAGAQSGHLSHSGYWKIAQPTERESGGSMEGPVALVIKARQRSVRQGGRVVSLPSSRSFRLVVDVVFKNEEGEVERNFYLIGGAKWRRVG